MHAHSDCGCGHKHTSRQQGCSISARPALGKISQINPLTCSSATCCDNDADCGGSSSADSPDDGSDSDSAGRPLSHRWQISGMDCPSCARKIEAVTRRIPGVSQAQVLFSTQILQVEAHANLLPAIEQAVAQAGFALKTENVAAAATTWSGIWRDNAALLLIAVLTAASLLVAHLLPGAANYAFSVTVLIGLLPVTRRAWSLLRNGQPFTIETLMSIATLGALLIGASAEAAMVLLLFMIGERLEAFAAQRARRGVSALMALKPETAQRINGNGQETVPLSALQPGDTIVISPGGRLPADGVLLSPQASFDESALTGESMPVAHQTGEALMAGALSIDASVQLRVTSRPGESAIDRILQLIEQAESHRAPVERFIDSFSRLYTPGIMVLALLTATLAPLFFAQPWHEWLYKGLTLLLIGCPCALVISVPASITSALASASRLGILIKGGAALEQLSQVRTLAFDKTGTLTAGQPVITTVKSFTTATSDTVLALAAATEQNASHPLAQAIIREAKTRKLTLPATRDHRAQAGTGVTARLGTSLLTLSSPASLNPALLDARQWLQVRGLEEKGNTVVILLRDGQPEGLLALRDRLRDSAGQALAELQKLGLHCVMLTGDNPQTAQAIATELKIDWRAGLLPADKVNEIERLSKTQPVAMIGDGINDSPAMKAATLGIAMGGGSDIALETADAALTHSRLSALAPLIRLARRTRRNIQQNIGIALGLKGIFLITSLLGITGLWLAVLADSGATALVTLNALRLLRRAD
ncbi:zinc/cadmium/mercury/lead-transporting ATPase [Erwinia sp. OLTSP20]|uniref:zinc/cadmium/mercury/lead-transporting ATPase n=1 Tax=unclassified Erwinia TaxID=2622719 RepID=UPI000C188C3D|nr:MULTISPECIES: zinc/cadmium/mercury/lead-transporting ATPase [unclassified Erwinia]PIJ51146.1 zinc/cadmium/mercury/lead-transporting ATPase [Erwinia sp. OAMSP11]PIJ73898.1 zinc/cadmium/mercury/lead-transporting ATPase [Erwinia sp. OLSSP12]PIJ83906.1 zinc/cadmium/mercury/lead-transporting ATPase [Erwinia sp. OLCASP19]PIJ86436.1 zinc/cadmium/mercury/lead-transporting ATPase [Erwinia sp. OLMTSP26]PIJ87915.1 zinc/cadmium/mercury/lead-transporting ATPase [Erwinia sp. OLMDSP33]